MPSLAACRCLFWLMRHCFLGRWEYTIFSFLLTKRMSNPNNQLLQFFSLCFKWWKTADWDVLWSSAEPRLHLHGLQFINHFKASWSKYDMFPGLRSSLNDVLLERNLKNSFKLISWSWYLSKKKKKKKLEITSAASFILFFLCFFFVILKLLQYYI